MKAAIAIDRWKYETFRSILTLEGYSFTEGDGVTPDSMILYVETNNPVHLHGVVKKCQVKAAELKN